MAHVVVLVWKFSVVVNTHTIVFLIQPIMMTTAMIKYTSYSLSSFILFIDVREMLERYERLVFFVCKSPQYPFPHLTAMFCYSIHDDTKW